MLVRAVQPLNVPPSIIVRLSEIVTLVSPVQFENIFAVLLRPTSPRFSNDVKFSSEDNSNLGIEVPVTITSNVLTVA